MSSTLQNAESNEVFICSYGCRARSLKWELRVSRIWRHIFWYFAGNQNYSQFIRPKIWSPSTGLHDFTTRKTTVWITYSSDEGT